MNEIKNGPMTGLYALVPVKNKSVCKLVRIGARVANETYIVYHVGGNGMCEVGQLVPLLDMNSWWFFDNEESVANNECGVVIYEGQFVSF